MKGSQSVANFRVASNEAATLTPHAVDDLALPSFTRENRSNDMLNLSSYSQPSYNWSDCSERSPSSTSFSHSEGADPSHLLQAYTRILTRLRTMQNRLDSLEQHIHGIAHESSHLKYSRRLLQVSNIVLALYIGLRTLRLFWLENAKNIIFSFWSEYALTARSPKEGVVRSFLRKRAKAALQNSDNRMKITWKSMRLLILSWFGGAFIRIVLLVFSTYWLQKLEIWKSRVGVWISFISNVHVALTTDVSPWTIYFNIFTLLTYITTRNYQHMIPQQIDRYVDYGIRTIAQPTRKFIHHQRQKNDPKKRTEDMNKFKRTLEELERRYLHQEKWIEGKGSSEKPNGGPSNTGDKSTDKINPNHVENSLNLENES